MCWRRKPHLVANMHAPAREQMAVPGRSLPIHKEEHMNTFVIYDSQFGNTERIARIIANT